MRQRTINKTTKQRSETKQLNNKIVKKRRLIKSFRKVPSQQLCDFQRVAVKALSCLVV